MYVYAIYILPLSSQPTSGGCNICIYMAIPYKNLGWLEGAPQQASLKSPNSPFVTLDDVMVLLTSLHSILDS